MGAKRNFCRVVRSSDLSGRSRARTHNLFQLLLPFRPPRSTRHNTCCRVGPCNRKRDARI